MARLLVAEYYHILSPGDYRTTGLPAISRPARFYPTLITVGSVAIESSTTSASRCVRSSSCGRYLPVRTATPIIPASLAPATSDSRSSPTMASEEELDLTDTLVPEPAGRGGGSGQDLPRLGRDPHAAQPLGESGAGAAGGIGGEAERDASPSQLGQSLGGSGDGAVFLVDRAVEVEKEACDHLRGRRSSTAMETSGRASGEIRWPRRKTRLVRYSPFLGLRKTSTPSRRRFRIQDSCSPVSA